MVDASMDPQPWARKQLEDADPDLLRALLQEVLEDIMGTEVDQVCNPAYGERTDERENFRNGYRRRRFDTRVGTMDLAILKLRSGAYSPTGCWRRSAPKGAHLDRGRRLSPAC
ncbi:MAG: transposase [Actinobacteria bacterium]|nr:transposase [Actinomycetota bacterium]